MEIIYARHLLSFLRRDSQTITFRDALNPWTAMTKSYKRVELNRILLERNKFTLLQM